MLCLSVSTVLASITLLGAIIPQYTYYAVAGFDFGIVLALFVTLKQMQQVIATVPTLLNFEGEVYARKFVTTFGISFIIALGLNFLKSLYWNNYITII